MHEATRTDSNRRPQAYQAEISPVSYKRYIYYTIDFVIFQYQRKKILMFKILSNLTIIFSDDIIKKSFLGVGFIRLYGEK